MQNLHDTHSTIKFLKLFDRAFDCLNVMSQKRDKPDRMPYRNVNDPRFEVIFFYVCQMQPKSVLFKT